MNKIIKILEEEFIKADKSEPFLDRNYVRESKRIFNLLRGRTPSDFNSGGRAIYDIVLDITWYFEKRKAHISSNFIK